MFADIETTFVYSVNDAGVYSGVKRTLRFSAYKGRLAPRHDFKNITTLRARAKETIGGGVHIEELYAQGKRQNWHEILQNSLERVN
jgi:hypothetical protein